MPRFCFFLEVSLSISLCFHYDERVLVFFTVVIRSLVLFVAFFVDHDSSIDTETQSSGKVKIYVDSEIALFLRIFLRISCGVCEDVNWAELGI